MSQKHIVIGTAGHVDHGKTTLTRALIGSSHQLIDRLKEEKKRGITITLGFAQLNLPNGESASIIDVPGHEKLIKNMLMGAAGIDLVLLVVSSDKGFQPQTKEHLEILELLGVQKGIIVMTKADAVDEEMLEIVREDIRENVKGSFLEDAPVVPVSALTGMNIEELKWEIIRVLATIPDRPNDKPFRLPVDRVFTIKGFGTVVTGTTLDGVLSTGDNVMIYPQEKPSRVRELQNHEVKQESVTAGMRVAINLSGVEKKELNHNCTIAEPGSMQLTKRVAVKLQLTKDAAFSVKNSARVHFHLGTQGLLGKVRLLDRDELLAGESCYANITFDEQMNARNLDRFIIRFFSPMITIGGGTILDMESERLRRNDERVLNRMAMLAGSAEDRVQQIIEDAGRNLIKEETIITMGGLSATEVKDAVKALLKSGKVSMIRAGLITQNQLDNVWEKLSETLREFHEQNSLDQGMHLGELRVKIFATTPKTADAIMEHFCDRGMMTMDGSTAALTEFVKDMNADYILDHFANKTKAKVEDADISPRQRAMMEELDKLYSGYGLEAPNNTAIAEIYKNNHKIYRQASTYMLKYGTLVALNDNVTAHRSACKKALDVLLEMFKNSEAISLGDFRDALGVSRKFAMLYLDYFDAQMITRMVGDKRVLQKKQ